MTLIFITLPIHQELKYTAKGIISMAQDNEELYMVDILYGRYKN